LRGFFGFLRDFWEFCVILRRFGCDLVCFQGILADFWCFFGNLEVFGVGIIRFLAGFSVV